MSIIQPNKRDNIVVLIIGIMLLFVVFTVGNIMIYSKTVSVTHELNSMKSELASLEVSNAGLETNLYTETDSDALSNIVAEDGLVQDKNPTWVIVSAQ